MTMHGATPDPEAAAERAIAEARRLIAAMRDDDPASVRAAYEAIKRAGEAVVAAFDQIGA